MTIHARRMCVRIDAVNRDSILHCQVSQPCSALGPRIPLIIIDINMSTVLLFHSA
jgi:hypothetical protein